MIKQVICSVLLVPLLGGVTHLMYSSLPVRSNYGVITNIIHSASSIMGEFSQEKADQYFHGGVAHADGEPCDAHETEGESLHHYHGDCSTDCERGDVVTHSSEDLLQEECDICEGCRSHGHQHNDVHGSDPCRVNVFSRNDGNGLIQKSDSTIARKVLEFYRTVKPQSPKHMDHVDDLRELLPWLWLALKVDPSNDEHYTTAAFWLQKVGAGEGEFVKLLEEGLTFSPRSCEILNYLAMYYYGKGWSYHARCLLNEADFGVGDFNQIVRNLKLRVACYRKYGQSYEMMLTRQRIELLLLLKGG